MKDQLFSDELAAVFQGDLTITELIPHIHGAMSGEITDRPSLTFHGEFTHYLRHRKGTAMIELRSRLDAETEAAEVNAGHQAQFEAVWNKLLGSLGANDAAARMNRAAKKEAIKAALAVRGKVTLIEYGPAGGDTVSIESDVDGDDLRTVLRIMAVWVPV